MAKSSKKINIVKTKQLIVKNTNFSPLTKEKCILFPILYIYRDSIKYTYASLDLQKK